jgi:hypothetical protein
MTQRDELLALAERCEKAREGSRELDGLIWKAACEKPGDIWSRDLIDGNIWMRQDPEDTVAYEAPPAYTTSLDAAMTLVPTGHDWSLFFDNGSALAGCMPSSEDGCDWIDVPGATPALALCAAALRAAAEMEG